MIAVIDYGMGNLRSVAKALAHVAPDANVVVTSDAAVIRDAARVVLPGQSAMPDTMAALERSGLRDAVLACLRDRPFLGVCLGLQMLFDTSEEGPTRCLGTFAGEAASAVRRHRQRRALLFRAQLPSGAGGSGADRRHRFVSGAVYLRDSQG